MSEFRNPDNLIRTSALNQAIEFLRLLTERKNVSIYPEYVLATAKKFEEYIKTGNIESVKG